MKTVQSFLRCASIALPLVLGTVSAGAAEAPAKPAPAVKPAEVKPAAIAALPIESSVKLPNGVTLVTRADRTAPRVAISLLVRAGGANELAGTAGWRRILTNAMLRASYNKLTPGSAQLEATKTEGAAPAGPAVLTGAHLQRLAESLGGRIGASIGDDVIEFWAIGESRNGGVLLDLLLNLVENPRLSDEDITAAKRSVAVDTEIDASDIAVSATSSLRSQIYRDASGKPLAYGLPKSTPESLRGLSADKIRAFYAKFFQPSQYFAGVAGDIDSAALGRRLEAVTASKAFAEITEHTEVPLPAAPDFHPAAKTDPPLVVKQLPTQDAWVFVSFLAAKSNASDAAALRVLSAALGESTVARLPKRLLSRLSTLGSNDSQALQTSVSVSYRRYGSEFVVYAQTSASNVDGIKNALLDEVRKLREAPLSADELQRAKNFVRGSLALDRESLRERSFNAALAPATGAPLDETWPSRVERVTAADVRRVAQQYTQNYAVALIMPQE